MTQQLEKVLEDNNNQHSPKTQNGLEADFMYLSLLG